MISRVWHGWTMRDHADSYERMLRATILPGIHRVPGYRGADLLRRDDGDEVEFVTITRFDSMDAVRAFAGPDYEVAVASSRISPRSGRTSSGSAWRLVRAPPTSHGSS